LIKGIVVEYLLKNRSRYTSNDDDVLFTMTTTRSGWWSKDGEYQGTLL
jgi:hypothetical protein